MTLAPCRGPASAAWCCEYHAIHSDDDFSEVYLAALDVSESIVEPERETPPQRRLREVLAKYREDIESVSHHPERESCATCGAIHAACEPHRSRQRP